MQVEEDDIIVYDSDEHIRNRTLRKRNPVVQHSQNKSEIEEQATGQKKRGRKPKNY